MKGKYLYGVISEASSLHLKLKLTNLFIKKDDNQNLSLNGLTTVAYQSLAAVVEEKEVKDYHKLPKEETVKELISHQQIIEKIMSESTILPVKFGTFLKGEEEVTSVLEKGYFFLRNTLRRIEDKIELDLVCFWNEAKAAQMACQESKKIRDYYTSEVARPARQRLRRKALAGGRGSSDGEMEAKIALGKLVADYLAGKREELRNQILKILNKETVESCSHALADVNMLLNQAFLIEKNNEESFNRALNKLDGQFADLIDFRLVGPLPPYSFTTLVIDRLDEKEVEKARETLKLNGQFSLEKLKQTYHKLAMRLHPDKGGNPLEFELVTDAYKLLKNFIENGLVAVSLYKPQDFPAS